MTLVICWPAYVNDNLRMTKKFLRFFCILLLTYMLYQSTVIIREVITMNIKELRQRTGLSQSQFADYFEIPVRTIQKWERNGSTPPEYIPKMMERILDLEDKLHGKGL